MMPKSKDSIIISLQEAIKRSLDGIIKCQVTFEK